MNPRAPNWKVLVDLDGGDSSRQLILICTLAKCGGPMYRPAHGPSFLVHLAGPGKFFEPKTLAARPYEEYPVGFCGIMYAIFMARKIGALEAPVFGPTCVTVFGGEKP